MKLRTIRLTLFISVITVLIASLVSCKENHTHSFDRRDTNPEYLKSEQTCESGAVYYYSCSCGEKGTDTFVDGDALDHSYSDSWSKDDTYHWNAAICDHSNEVINKAEHTWDEGAVVTQPTEEAAGEFLNTCTVCGYEKRSEVPALEHSHTFSDSWSQDDTHHWHEATCGHSEVSARAEHTWDSGQVTTESTENSEGVMTYTCVVCSKTKNEPIPEKEHVHVFTVRLATPEYLSTEATCEQKATYFFSCVCTEKGSDTFEDGGLAAHSYGEYISNNDATCDADGTKSATCEVCEHTDTISDPNSKQEHSFANYWSGNEDYHWYAATCGHDDQKKDYGEHSWNEGEIITYPTEETDGQKHQTCTICLKERIVSVPALGHVHTFDTEWTNDDDYHWHAANCAHTDQKADMEAHDFRLTDEGYDATVYEQGSDIYECSVCGMKKEVVLDKLDAFTVAFLDYGNNSFFENSYIIGTSDVIVPTAPAKPGYRFIEWLNISSNTVVESYNFASVSKNTTVTFTPVYKQEFTVVFADYNGAPLKTITVLSGDHVSSDLLPAIPERTGYTAAWGPAVTENAVTSDMTVTPIYSALTFDVAFVDAEGNLLYYTDHSGVNVGVQTVNYGAFAIAPECPAYRFDAATLKLYEFTGWSTNIERITANHTGENAIKPLYEKEVDHPVIAIKISGNTAKISITLPSGAKLYSLKLSGKWSNTNGLCGITASQIESISSLNKDACGETLCTVGDKHGESGWITFNNKNYTFDFLWTCGNGHTIGAENVFTLTFESPSPSFVLDESIMEILESSSVIYGDATVDITELQKSDVFVWFYE